ncbi:MAG: carbohydrate ABC transporter permease, partial [Sphaerochaetaceae bacterium]
MHAKSKIKQKRRTTTLLVLANIVFGFVFILPLLWMVASALKPEQRIFQDIGSWKAFVPVGFTFENFRQMLERVPMFKYIWNSIVYITIMLSVSLIVNSLCGYALAKFQFKGKKFFLSLIIALMVFPFDSIVVPLFV